MEYTRLWLRKIFILPKYKKLVLEAYRDKNSQALKEIQTSNRRLYGWEKVQDLKPDLAFHSRLWQAMCEVYKDGEEIDLGIISTGYRDVALKGHSRSVLESNIYLMGFYDELSAIQEYAQYVRPGSIAVDVGANVGAHTFSLSSMVGPSGKVHAYEPRASILESLRANITLNKAQNVIVHAVGLGKEQGKIPFNEEDGHFNQGIGHFDPDSKVFIPITSLDDDLGRIEGRISLIKIDVEGYELQVIEGAREVLAKHRPAIVLEYNSPPWSMADILKSCPWHAQVFRLPNNFYEKTSQVLDFGSLVGFNNILILPKEGH
jgi:FkbM family methyltransferase